MHISYICFNTAWRGGKIRFKMIFCHYSLTLQTNQIDILGEWTHIAVTYDSTKEIAVIYINGEIKEGATGEGALSEDWDGRAAFGYHEGVLNSFDYFDEIYMFDRELSPLEIRQMFMKCSDVLPYGMYVFKL